MSSPGAMNDFEEHFGNPKTPPGEFSGSVLQVQCAFESILIRTNYEAEAFKVWTEYQSCL